MAFEMGYMEEVATTRAGNNVGATVKGLLARATKLVTVIGGVWHLVGRLLAALDRADIQVN